MRVLHVIPSLSPKHGGPSAALPAIARALIGKGVDVTIATTDDDGAGCRMDVPPGAVMQDADGAGRIHFRKNTEFYKVSSGLGRWLRQHAGEFDVVHVHALFSYSSGAAARAAKRAAVPSVVRPLGVLNRWGMQNRRRALKQWSLRFVELPILRGAAAIHYTADAERREAAEANAEIAGMRAAVIPLPVELPLETGTRGERGAEDVILFLSRIDPKKGVELLLEAFAKIAPEFPRTKLMMAGDGESEYVATLKARAVAAGIAEKIVWSGFIGGAEKASAFTDAVMFVLPSYSENFGIAAAEALAAGVPSVLSENVAVADDARAADAALVVRCDAEELAAAMRRLLTDDALRERLAANGRRLVREKFSAEAVGASLVELYEDVMTKARADA